jgi:thiol-disulfide isomerase/thioredoxin
MTLLGALLLVLSASAPVAAQEPGSSPAGGVPPEAADQLRTTAISNDVRFTEGRFEELQGRDALILVDVHADWCSTCKSQQEVLADFREEHPDVPLHVLKVDFDEQKKWVRHFEAPRQSTLILYRGQERVWFGVAENRRDVIFSRILSAAGDGRTG